MLLQKKQNIHLPNSHLFLKDKKTFPEKLPHDIYEEHFKFKPFENNV